MDKKTLIPANPETKLGKVYASLLAKLALIGLYDYYIGFVRSQNQIKCFFSGSADKEEIEKLVDMYQSSDTSRDDDGVVVGVKYYADKYEDEPCYVVELFCEQFEVEQGDEDFVPTQIDLEGDVEPKKSQEPESEEDDMNNKEETITCTNCGKFLNEDDIDWNMESLTEDAKMICPVCKSEYTISALLTKPGGGEEDAGIDFDSAPEMDRDISPGSTPSEEPEGGGGDVEAPTGAEGPESFQIGGGLEDSIKPVINILENLSKGTMSVDEAYTKLLEAEELVWKGCLVDFQSKLFGVANDLGIPFEKVDEFVKELYDGDGVMVKSGGLEVNVDKSIGIVVEFLSNMGFTTTDEMSPIEPVETPEPPPVTDEPDDLTLPDDGAIPDEPEPIEGAKLADDDTDDVAKELKSLGMGVNGVDESVRDDVLKQEKEFKEKVSKVLRKYFA